MNETYFNLIAEKKCSTKYCNNYIIGENPISINGKSVFLCSDCKKIFNKLDIRENNTFIQLTLTTKKYKI